MAGRLLGVCVLLKLPGGPAQGHGGGGGCRGCPLFEVRDRTGWRGLVLDWSIRDHSDAVVYSMRLDEQACSTK